ncbi:MAG: TonB-dependent receptor domain-containing protein [Pseudomonas sp.]
MFAPFARTALASALVSCSFYTLADTNPLTLNDTVVSASGFEQKITEAPASISVISREELQEKRFSSIAEALQDVEGVDVHGNTGKTGGLNISIRGMPSEYTLILIDGRRQNAPGDVAPNGFGETSTSFMPPPSAIERIEVIRGPMSTLYGSDALGGVVNIITRKVGKEWGSAIGVEHTLQENSDYGDSSKINFYTSGPLIENKLGLALRGSFYDRDSSDLEFSDSKVPLSSRGPSPVEAENWSAGGRLSFTPTQDHDFTLDLDRSVQTYGNDECQLGTLDGRDRSCAPKPTSGNGYANELRFEREQATLAYTARLDFGTLDTSLMRNTTETIGRTLPGTIGSDIGIPGSVGGDDRELKTTNLVFDTKLVTPIGDSNLLTLGGQWWDAEMDDGLAMDTFEQTTWALFAENEWRIRNNLALTLGARYDDHETFGSHISPRAYLVWNTSDNWTMKGGISKGYKTPNVNDLHDGINGVTRQGEVITVGTPGLDPEESTSYEFGVYYENHSGFNANATLFHTKFKDKIMDGPEVDCAANPGGTYCGLLAGKTQTKYGQLVNVGEAETQGIELATRIPLANAWWINANYTYTDSEQESGDNKGRPLTNTPEHMLNTRLNWQATDRLKTWLAYEYRSDTLRFLDARSNLSGNNAAVHDQVGNKLSAYSLFHLGAAYRATQNLTLQATIYNLFDKDFLRSDSYIGSSGLDYVSEYSHSTRSTSGYIPEGRRLWLSANFTF